MVVGWLPIADEGKERGGFFTTSFPVRPLAVCLPVTSWKVGGLYDVYIVRGMGNIVGILSKGGFLDLGER